MPVDGMEKNTHEESKEEPVEWKQLQLPFPESFYQAEPPVKETDNGNTD
tara:strand:+ start:3514 stop:3660 length:147 start_codon:yes stop_codon:yes gene_type:complete